MGKIKVGSIGSMKGAEFIWTATNGVVHNAFVAAVDKNLGMTIKSLDIELTEAEASGSGRKRDELWCLDIKVFSKNNCFSHLLSPKAHLIQTMVDDLNEINDTGKLSGDDALFRFYLSDPTILRGAGGGGCAF